MSIPTGRRRARRLLPAAALVLCAAGCAPADREPAATVEQVREADGATLRLTLDRRELTTVETLLLTLEVEAAESDRVAFPNPAANFGEFEAAGDRPAAARLGEDGRVTRGHSYTLEPFLPGEFDVPSLTVTLNGSTEIATDPVTVTVTSVLDDPESADLRDIGGPVDVPAPWWWWALGGLTAAAAAAMGYFLWRKRKRKAAAPPPLPHETALAAMRALLAENLPAQGVVKPFYRRLSSILRRYIEDRFGLRAPEQTTEEFLEAMRGSHAVERAHKDLLQEFLHHADMVKFAELTPEPADAERMADSARRFIEQTIPQTEPEREKSAGPHPGAAPTHRS